MAETMTDFAAEREAMVERQIAGRGIREPTILEAFRAVPREEFLAQDYRELAYGDLKRLELAIALANQPKLLLMDEPTAGMAPRERIELMRLTARIAREKSIGVLFTEHDMDVVFEHADRILVLNRGSLIAEGTPEEVRGNPQVRAIYLGEGLVYDARHREGAGA